MGVGHVHIQDWEFQKLKTDVLNKTLFGPNLIPDLDMHIQQSKYLIQVVQKHAQVNYNIIIDTQVEKLVWKFKKKIQNTKINHSTRANQLEEANFLFTQRQKLEFDV